jgi:hypothetical protein
MLGRETGEDVNTYAYTLGSLDAGANYTLVLASSPATFSITAKPITVTADEGQSKVIGAVDPTFTYTSSDLAATFTGALDRVLGENVGAYAIGQGTLAVVGSNYSMSFVSKDFSITQAISTHSISLVPGWNLVSFNVQLEDTDIIPVLASIAGNYNLVYAWDATGAHSTSGNWMKYAPPPAAPYANTLHNLDETIGFWIHMTTADTLEVTGKVPVTTDIDLSINAGGWNLVAYPSGVNRPLPAALNDNGIGTDYSLVYAYHANDSTDVWKLFNRTGLPYANDLTQMAPGWGYWVKLIANKTWSLTDY